MHTAPLLATAGSEPVSLVLVLPFALLLLLIAIMPLTGERGRHLWEHYHPHVAGFLALIVVGWYLLKRTGGAHMVTHTLHEYFSFISLIGSLFIAAGGVRISMSGRSTPIGNVVFLFIGAMIANVVGTTGASMVMIRPWLRMNRWRITGFHVVFFIFVISNVGGSLTPIGDPPLFLGYLRGVPFFWLVERAAIPWLFTISLILVVFYVFDRWSFTRATKAEQETAAEPDKWEFEGWRNIALIAVIIGAVFLPPTYFIREIAMIAAAVVSCRVTPKSVYEANHFTFAPIREVAALFIGIFMTMMPALNYLEQHGADFGFRQPAQYYFATGSLSAVLDNAPTYVNFLQLAEASMEHAELHDAPMPEEPGNMGVQRLLATAPRLVLAISLGAVFFGSMTYIGNGPNFMVKSIAEAAGVRVPTFFGYLIKFSLPILLPIFALTGYVFLAH